MNWKHRIIGAALLGGLCGAAPAAEYKCYVRDLEGRPQILRFETDRDLPQRPAGNSGAHGHLPAMVRSQSSQILECARRDLEFHSRDARALERQTPL